jgi:hypothetical protein
MESPNQLRDCTTCKHHHGGSSIDDAPSHCWDCVGTMGRYGHHLPFWEPKEKEKEMSDGATAMLEEEGSAFKTQVGGKHYKSMKIQPVEFCIANKLDFFQKDIIKYVTRVKGDKMKRLEDLHKAKHYLEMYIEAIHRGEWPHAPT